MKLFYDFYWAHEVNNFGDILNPWLWPQLLPGVFDEDERAIFVGFCTILHNLTEKSHKIITKKSYKIIFSTGAGYGEPPPIDDRWKIYCVRGPRTAEMLGLPRELGIIDGAAMVRLLDLPNPAKNYAVSFMPHWRSATYWDWRQLCDEIGIHYISPTGNYLDTIRQIQQSELLLTECLHGAIVGDALRTPWIPLRNYKHILAFKWQDWCESVGLTYRPVFLPSLYNESKVSSKLQEVLGANRARYSFFEPFIRFAVSGTTLTARYANKVLADRATRRLQKIATNAAPVLSSEQAIASATTRFQEQLAQFQADYASGYFDDS